MVDDWARVNSMLHPSSHGFIRCLNIQIIRMPDLACEIWRWFLPSSECFKNGPWVAQLISRTGADQSPFECMAFDSG